MGPIGSDGDDWKRTKLEVRPDRQEQCGPSGGLKFSFQFAEGRSAPVDRLLGRPVPDPIDAKAPEDWRTPRRKRQRDAAPKHR